MGFRPPNVPCLARPVPCCDADSSDEPMRGSPGRAWDCRRLPGFRFSGARAVAAPDFAGVVAFAALAAAGVSPPQVWTSRLVHEPPTAIPTWQLWLASQVPS